MTWRARSRRAQEERTRARCTSAFYRRVHGHAPWRDLALKWLPSAEAVGLIWSGSAESQRAEARRSNKRQPTARIHADCCRTQTVAREGFGAGITAVSPLPGRADEEVAQLMADVARPRAPPRQDAPHIMRHTAATWQMQAGTDFTRRPAISACRRRRCGTPTGSTIPTISRKLPKRWQNGRATPWFRDPNRDPGVLSRLLSD